MSDLIDVYKKKTLDLTKIRVVEKIDDNFVIIQSADKQLVNTNEKQTSCIGPYHFQVTVVH